MVTNRPRLWKLKIRRPPSVRTLEFPAVGSRNRGLDAVVSTVDLDEFGEEALRRNLEDLGWLERVARRHDEVVHAVARRGPAAPLRLATVCLDDEAVRRRLDEWHDPMSAVLDRIDGRSEWSVKIVMPGAPASEKPSEDAVTSGPGSGAAYLMRKREQAARRRSAGEDAAAMAERVHLTLAEASVASRRLPPQDAKLTGRTETMVMNGAYLVPDLDHDAFVALVEQVRESEPTAIVEVGGPWPPYSFAVLE